MSYEELQTITKLIIENCEPCKLSKVLSSVQNLIDEHDIDNKKENIIHFTLKEIANMPKEFRKTFRTKGYNVHVSRQTRGKSKYYVIRFRKKGYDISICTKTLEEAKEKFLEKIKTTTPNNDKTSKPKTLNDFAKYYYPVFRKKQICPENYNKDLQRYRKYIEPVIGYKRINTITPMDCQVLLDKIIETGKERTAEEIRNILSILFKGAISHYLIEKNPMQIVQIEKHERKHGTALLKDEEKTLMDALSGTKYSQTFALMLYTGLRPNELKTVRIEGSFIVAKNSKRKHGKIEYKKIPISPMLKPYLTSKEISIVSYEDSRIKMKEILPNHIPYDLRTTFYTRLKECGVADNAIKEFVGHSLGILGETYTDLSDEFLLREGQKYLY